MCGKMGLFSRYLLGIGLSLFCLSAYAFYDPPTDEASSSWPPTVETPYHSPSTHSHRAHNTQYKAVAHLYPQQEEGTGRALFTFDPRVREWAVYDASGNLLATGHGSGGRNFCSDIHKPCHTPVGIFHVYAREGANCKSKIFPVPHGGAPMPYCSYFHGGFAVHGSYEVRSYNASHGCIRIMPSAAQWLQTVLPIGSTVIVTSY